LGLRGFEIGKVFFFLEESVSSVAQPQQQSICLIEIAAFLNRGLRKALPQKIWSRFVRDDLERLYMEFNRRDLVSPDPLQFVWEYDSPDDREVVGLIASSLAFGNVAQILRSVSAVLEKTPHPARWIMRTREQSMRELFRGFRHRFVDGDNLVDLMIGIRRARERWGSLRGCFEYGLSDSDSTVEPALIAFVKNISGDAPTTKNYLLPTPERGSACKRLNLFLRWMVRSDEVDPGVWNSPLTAKLLVPVDTHMHRIGLGLGFTSRRQGNLKTAIDITEGFRRICPEDPVRYDFALTRLGMKKDRRLERLFRG
jgi:uncharacterized protein (TIGR02757 family)